MERNLALYPVFHVARAGFFWLPVFFLFFTSRVSAAEAVQLQALYYALFVVLEVPSGYASDRFGRRPTLLISAAAGVLGGLLLFQSETFWGLALGQACLATWHAFHSGTDTALLFDSLHELGREDEYGRREARAEALGRFAIGVAALVGGLTAARDLAIPYALFAGSCAAAGAVVLAFREPPRERAGAPLQQAREVLGDLRDGTLRWLFVFVVGMTIVHHIPYELFQAWLDLMLAELEVAELDTPLVAGVVMAVNMWIAALGARVSIWLLERFGAGLTLVLAGAMQVGLILSMGAVLHPAVALLITLRSLPPGIAGPVISATAQPRLSGARRATFFSLMSLLGRSLLAGVALLISLSFKAEDPTWPELSRVLLVAGGASGLFVLALALSSRALRPARPRRAR